LRVRALVLGALAAHRQAAAVTEAAVAAQVHQALDVDRDLAAQVALDRHATDFVADLLEVAVGQILDLLSLYGMPQLSQIFCAVVRPMP
jgi:hypothetical protein